MPGDRNQETNAAGQCSQTPAIQSMMKHRVEKVEMNVAMLTAVIEKRAADVDVFERNVDDELSDLRCETVSESRDSSCQDGHHSRERTQMLKTMTLHSAWTPSRSVPSGQRWRARPCQVLHVRSLAKEERPPELVSSSVCDPARAS